MAQNPLFNLPGVPQHVIQRGHNRKACFYSDRKTMKQKGQTRLKYVTTQDNAVSTKEK